MKIEDPRFGSGARQIVFPGTSSCSHALDDSPSERTFRETRLEDMTRGKLIEIREQGTTKANKSGSYFARSKAVVKRSLPDNFIPSLSGSSESVLVLMPMSSLLCFRAPSFRDGQAISDLEFCCSLRGGNSLSILRGLCHGAGDRSSLHRLCNSDCICAGDSDGHTLRVWSDRRRGALTASDGEFVRLCIDPVHVIATDGGATVLLSMYNPSR